MNKYVSKYLFYYPVTFLKGELIAKYLSAYERFQWNHPYEIEMYQVHALQALVRYAQRRIPFYRKSFNDAGIQPEDIKNLDDLIKVPYLGKEQLRSCYQQLSVPRLLASRKTTGGSTGQAVTLRKNVDALARERAATWRGYRWAGIDIGDPQARFWGLPLDRRARFAATITDLIANRTRLSAFGITEERLQKYYKRILRFKPTYFYGYVSVIDEFAKFVEAKGLSLPPTVKAVITTSEVLDGPTRHYFERVFGCRVYDEYGCGEVGSIAHECENGSMHIMADNLIVEVLKGPKTTDDSGELVVTDLFNYATPLVRYKLGDYATLSNRQCNCGRGLPTIQKVHGRAYDMVIDKHGKKYHPEIIMYIFEDFKNKYGTVKQFQVIQKDFTTLEIVIVPAKEYSITSETIIKSAILARIGNSFEVEFKYGTEIEREKSGKIRLVKSELKEHETAR